jgi:hypothetical protein
MRHLKRNVSGVVRNPILQEIALDSRKQ